MMLFTFYVKAIRTVFENFQLPDIHSFSAEFVVKALCLLDIFLFVFLAYFNLLFSEFIHLLIWC